jgi:undecaprenyl-diphosphatase
MNIFNALLLGLIQGLTEFLPISSSGHLVIAQSLIDFSQPGVLFDTVLHLATTAAVIVYFRYKILHIKKADIKILIIGMLPAVIVGLFFRSFIEDLFTSTKIVGFALLLTATMNYFTDKAQARRRKINVIDSLVIGAAQAFAIIPGVSRSGSTIFAGTSLGVERSTAAEYSFLLSVPTIIGANVLELYTHGVTDSIPLPQYIIGFIAAFVTGFITIGILMRLLTERRFKFFALYAAIVGILTIVAV